MPFASIAKGVFHIVHEAARHLRRRPAMTIAVAVRTEGGQCLLVRRVDEGEWTLPGGLLRWGETLRECVTRHVQEAGVAECGTLRIVGVDSRPVAGAGLHSVTVIVACTVGDAACSTGRDHGLAEARFFEASLAAQVLRLG